MGSKHDVFPFAIINFDSLLFYPHQFTNELLKLLRKYMIQSIHNNFELLKVSKHFSKIIPFTKQQLAKVRTS